MCAIKNRIYFHLKRVPHKKKKKDYLIKRIYSFTKGGKMRHPTVLKQAKTSVIFYCY